MSNRSKCNPCINEDSCLLLDITSCDPSSQQQNKCCHSSTLQLLVKERDELKAELDRIQEELALTSREKHQSAEFGLQLLDQKEELQKRYDDLEVAFDGTRCELEALRTALAKSQTSQKVSATTGIEQEETLLKESAKKEATFASALAELERELKLLRAELDRVKSEKERLLAEHCDMAKQLDLHDWERKNMRSELKDLKLRESRLLQEMNELEDENISLRKQVSSLRSSQIEFESAKHEIIRLQEELELRRLQVEEFESLKNLAEKQMREALEALESEREQKYELKKKLDERMHFDSALGSFGLGFSSSHSSGKYLKDSSSNCTLNSTTSTTSVTPASQLIVNGSSSSSTAMNCQSARATSTSTKWKNQNRARSSCTSSSSFTYFDAKMNSIRDSFLNSKSCNSTSQQEQTRSFSSEVIASSLSTCSTSSYICCCCSSSFISSSPFCSSSNFNSKCSCSNNGKEISFKSESNCKQLHSQVNNSKTGPTTGVCNSSKYNNKCNRKTELECDVYDCIPSSTSLHLPPPPSLTADATSHPPPPPPCDLFTSIAITTTESTSGSFSPSDSSSLFLSQGKFNLLSPSSLTSVTLTSGNSSASSTSTYPLSVTPASNSSSSYINSPLSSSLYSTSNSTSTSSPISMAVNAFATSSAITNNNINSSNSVPLTSSIVSTNCKDATDATSPSSSSPLHPLDDAAGDVASSTDNSNVNCNGASDGLNCNSESNNSSINNSSSSSGTCCNSNNGSSSCSSYHTCCSTCLPTNVPLCPQEQEEPPNQKSPSTTTSSKLNEIEDSILDAEKTSQLLMSSSSDITFCNNSDSVTLANASASSSPSSTCPSSMSEASNECKMLPFKTSAGDEDGEEVKSSFPLCHSQSSDRGDQVTSLPCEWQEKSNCTMQTDSSLLCCDGNIDRASVSKSGCTLMSNVGDVEEKYHPQSCLPASTSSLAINQSLTQQQESPVNTSCLCSNCSIINGKNNSGDGGTNNGAKDALNGINGISYNSVSNCDKVNNEMSQHQLHLLAGTSIVSPRNLIDSIKGHTGQADVFTGKCESGNKKKKNNFKVSPGYESPEVDVSNAKRSIGRRSEKQQRKLVNSLNGCTKRPKSLITEYTSSNFTSCNSTLSNFFITNTAPNSLTYSANCYLNNNSGCNSLTSETFISKSPEFTLPVIDFNHKSTKIESNLSTQRHQQQQQQQSQQLKSSHFSKSNTSMTSKSNKSFTSSIKGRSKIESNNLHPKKGALRLTNSDFLLGMQNGCNQIKNSYPFSSDQLNSDLLNSNSRDAVKSYSSLTVDSMLSNYLCKNSLTPISVESLNVTCDSHHLMRKDNSNDSNNCHNTFHMNNKYKSNCANNLAQWEKDSSEFKSKLSKQANSADCSSIDINGGQGSDFKYQSNGQLKNGYFNDSSCLIEINSRKSASNMRLSPVSQINCDKPTLRRKVKLIYNNRCSKVKSIHPLHSFSCSSLNKKSFFIVIPGKKKRFFITSSNKGGLNGQLVSKQAANSTQLKRKFICYSNSWYTRKSTSALWSHRVSSGRKNSHTKTTNSGVASEPDYSSKLDHLDVPSITVLTALSNLTRSGSLDSDIDSHQATCTSSGSGNSSVDCNHHSAVLFDNMDVCGVVNCEATKKARSNEAVYASVLPRNKRRVNENGEEDKTGLLPSGPFAEVSPALENVTEAPIASTTAVYVTGDGDSFTLARKTSQDVSYATDDVIDLRSTNQQVEVASATRNFSDTDVTLNKKQKNTRHSHVRHLAVAVTDASAKLLLHQSHENGGQIEGQFGDALEQQVQVPANVNLINDERAINGKQQLNVTQLKSQVKESNEKIQKTQFEFGKSSTCSPSLVLMRKSVTHETALNSSYKLKTKSPAIATINTHDFDKIDKLDGLCSPTESAKSSSPSVKLNKVRALSGSFYDNLSEEPRDTNSTEVKVDTCIDHSSNAATATDSLLPGKSKNNKNSLQVQTRSSNVCVSALKATVRALAGCFLGLFAP